MKNKTKLASVALAAVLLVFGIGTGRAYGFDGGCRSRIEREQRDLYQAERLYGPYSWQANEERFELRRILDRCGYTGYNYYGGNGLFFGGSFFVSPRHDRDRDDRWRDRDNRWRHGDNDHDRNDHHNHQGEDRDRH